MASFTYSVGLQTTLPHLGWIICLEGSRYDATAASLSVMTVRFGVNHVSTLNEGGETKSQCLQGPAGTAARCAYSMQILDLFFLSN